MKCFSLPRKKHSGAERAVSLDENEGSDSDHESSPTMGSDGLSSARRSFRSRVRAIQNAQRFINSNPKLRSSHPSYGSKAARPEASSALLHLGGRARSVTELGSALLDVVTACHPRSGRHLDSICKNSPLVAAANWQPRVDDVGTNLPIFQPLPSPLQVSNSPHKVARSSNVYRLPLPSDHFHNISCPLVSSLKSSSSNATCTHNGMQLPLAPKCGNSSLRAVSSCGTAPCHPTKINSNSVLSVQIHHPQDDVAVVSSLVPGQDVIIQANCYTAELQPLPPPSSSTLAGCSLRCFKYDDLLSACQNFSHDHHIADTDECFNGTIKVKGSFKAGKHQDVLVLVLSEPQQQGFQEWMLKVSMVAHDLHESLHVCQLIGFCEEDGCAERMLVYERLKKGTLFSLLFEASNLCPLEWSLRMKIAYGAAEGLTSLHAIFPDIVLYRDFRASCIQVDHDYSSKVCLYRFLNRLNLENQTSLSNSRVKAYRAPETVSRGELTLKSNVWSYGVILLELLSGRQHLGEDIAKTERLNLVKWAKPFLIDEGKLFLLMDPKLQGNFPSRGAKMVAHLALLCLRKNPAKRPTMREALDVVRDVHFSRCATHGGTRGPTATYKACSSSVVLLPSQA
ncbi:hypothetical protein L7F22_030875 [Adiantum nelumboides]|nr:hypothetical protein [Adiantum nelumboides]